MKITKVDAFQLSWDLSGNGTRSAFVRIETEDGAFGLGEASPMQGGLASLVIIANDMAPFLIGKDIFDHAVLLDTLGRLRYARDVLSQCSVVGTGGAR